MSRQLLFVDPLVQPEARIRDAFWREKVSLTVLHDVEAALEEISQNPPNVILVDLAMPRIVGFLRELRGFHAGVPVVLMCDPSAVEQAVAALAFGASDYVLKPLRSEEVVSRVTRILNLRDINTSESPELDAIPMAENIRLYQAVQRFEFDYVSRTLTRYSGDKRRAAKHLGISLSSLYRKLDLGASVS